MSIKRTSLLNKSVIFFDNYYFSVKQANDISSVTGFSPIAIGISLTFFFEYFINFFPI